LHARTTWPGRIIIGGEDSGLMSVTRPADPGVVRHPYEEGGAVAHANTMRSTSLGWRVRHYQ
jgi:hypothetical protein